MITKHNKMKTFYFLVSIFINLIFVSCNKDSYIQGYGYTDTTSNTVTTGTNTGVQALRDIDGNTYKTVKIGNQEWMAENLKVTKYRNGDAIPNVTNMSQWWNLHTGAYCCYNNNNLSDYGKLYNWYAATDPRGIAPNGWHVPSDAEWSVLENYLGGSGVAGGEMKEIGTTHWLTPNAGAINSSGFTALPGGENSGLVNGYTGINQQGFWWSSSLYSSGAAALYVQVFYSDGQCYFHSSQYQNYGMSIRCIKD
jgi:uncharacterized protein (TIGR02145 family)